VHFRTGGGRILAFSERKPESRKEGHPERTKNMTDSNSKLIQTIYEAFGRGDVQLIASKVRQDARWDFNVTKSDVPWHVPVTGPSEVPRFLAAFVENVTLEAFEPRQFIAAGDEVVVHVRIAYTVKRTGERVDQDQLHWWTVRDGKIARLRHFEDTAQVTAAWRPRT
jgi:ketosteroid isomerase-like protein